MSKGKVEEKKSVGRTSVSKGKVSAKKSAAKDKRSTSKAKQTPVKKVATRELRKNEKVIIEVE